MSADLYQTDCVIIGAGAVGLACAAELARRGRDVLVLEATSHIGSGTSSRNSEVIHAGLYYATGSMKHLFCVEGRRKLYAYAAERGIAHRKCGKLIVATNAAEETQIAALAARAETNGVENCRLMTRNEALAMEPNLTCVSALISEETGILDSHGYMLALVGEIEASGAIAFNAPFLRATPTKDGFEVEIGGDAPARIGCRVLINSAGLDAPRIASRIEGLTALPKQTLAKGNYFGCSAKPAFSRLIYPAPVDGGLGVHLTLDLGGRMRFGPDVEWLDETDPARVNYAVDLKRAESFYAAIRRYWPGLPDHALTPDYAGCRPKLSGPGQGAADFRIDGAAVHGFPGLINLFGIESPGLTSSPAIAAYVADLC